MDDQSVELSELSAEIGRLTNALSAAYERERNTRIALLRLHALTGITVGILVVFTGTASMFEDVFGVWVRPAIGGLAFISGILLLFGIQRKKGRYKAEITGLVLMGLWDMLMAVAIIGVVFSYNQPWVFPMPGTPEIPLDQPRLYAIAVYLMLGTMVWGVHLRAVLTDRKQHRV